MQIFKHRKMQLQDKVSQKKGNTIAFTVALIVFLAMMLWLFLM